MTKAKDPQLYASGYERNAGDRYWTHPWMVHALEEHLGALRVYINDLPIWECAAGRGDMASALASTFDVPVFPSDIDASALSDRVLYEERSFFDYEEPPQAAPDPIGSIITNPPYGVPYRSIADDFIEHALSFLKRDDNDIEFVAMLLRSEFASGKSRGRQEKFGRCEHYLGEIKLTTRPRWDYGDPDAPENAAPRHNFSWFLWLKGARDVSPYPVQLFDYRPKGFKP